MAGAYVKSNNATADASATTIATTLATVAAGNALTVFVLHEDAGVDVSGVADNVNGTYGARQATAILSTPNNERLSIFKFENSAVSATTVTITATFGGFVSFRRIWAVETSGHKSSPAIDGVKANNSEAPGTGTDAITTTNTSNASQPGFAITLAYDDDSASAPTQGTGWTDRGTGLGGSARLATRSVSTTGNIAGTFTSIAAHGGDKYAVGIVVYDDPTTAVTAPIWDGSQGTTRGAPVTRSQAFLRMGSDVAALAAATIVTLTSIGWIPVTSAPQAPVRGRRDMSTGAEFLPTVTAAAPSAAFVNWTSEATPRPVQRSQPAVEQTASTTLGFAPSRSFSSWSADAPQQVPRAVPRLLYVDLAGSESSPALYVDYAAPPAQGATQRSLRPAEQPVASAMLPLQSAVMQWTEPPARGTWRASRPSQETALGTLITSTTPTSFVPWTNELQRRPLPIEQDNAEQIFGALSFGAWAPIADPPPRTLPSRPAFAADPFIGTALGFAPSPAFAGWSSDSAVRAPVAPQRAFDPAALGPLQSTFVPWADASLRPLRNRPQAFPETPLPVLASPSPTSFVEWSVQPPPSWRFAATRPESTPTISDVTVPPTTAYLEWSNVPARGTAITARRAEPPSYLGTFVAPPTLTGTPWATEPLRSPWAGARPQNDQVLAPLTFAAFPWSSEVATRWTAARRQSVEPFLGTATAANTFSDWSSGPSRAVPQRANAAAAESPLTAWSGVAPFLEWSASSSRPSLSRPVTIDAGDLGTLIRALPSAFSLSAEPPPKPYQQPRQPTIEDALPATVVVVLPTLGWATFELPPRSPTYQARPLPSWFEGAVSADYGGPVTDPPRTTLTVVPWPRTRLT